MIVPRHLVVRARMAYVAWKGSKSYASDHDRGEACAYAPSVKFSAHIAGLEKKHHGPQLFWKVMDSYGFLWILMDSYGFFWILMDSYGFFWILMDSYGFLRVLHKKRVPICLFTFHMFLSFSPDQIWTEGPEGHSLRHSDFFLEAVGSHQVGLGDCTAVVNADELWDRMGWKILFLIHNPVLVEIN